MDLDKYFQPLNSPISMRQAVRSSFDFDSEQERNSVDLAHIRNFNFSQGQGGTLILGGTANGNGLLYLRNSLGSTIVQGDNTGLTINDGSITIKNSSAVSILDAGGIISTANFAVDNVEDVTVRTTTGTTPQDVPGSTLNTFILSRAAKSVIYVTAWGYNIKWLSDASTMQVQCLDSVDGTLVSFPLYLNQRLVSVSGASSPFTSFSYGVDYQFMNAAVVADLSAGTHTMKLQYYVNGTGTAELALYQLGYTILGN